MESSFPEQGNQGFFQNNDGFAQPADVNIVNLETMSAEELIKLAEENYETMNYDRCTIIYEEAFRRFSEDDRVLTSYGYFLTNNKEDDKAREVLSQAIYLNPNANPKKYLYIAQLFEGQNSATFYLKAVEILSAQLEELAQTNNQNGEVDSQDIRKDLSQAFTALGELYMTDLALTENAINICRDYLHRAVEVNETNLDAYYQLMNYYLEVDEPETAGQSATKLMEIYRQADESNNDDFFDEYPEETYLGTAKVLIEMQRFADAVFILEDLFEDNNKNMEVLYLLMYSNFMLKNYVACKEYLEDFNQKLEKGDYKDEEIIAAKEELEATLRNTNVEQGNDWEDVSEEHMSNGDDMELEH